MRSQILKPYPDVEPLPGGAFALRSPAKINLQLRVLGRRPDGYHEIDTLYQEISLADRLEFHSAVDWRLEVRGADLSTGDENLVTQAAELLSLSTGHPVCGHLLLHKTIPIGGGLGGGSSNAAVALLGLSRLWGLDWAADRLRPLAASLGSDCVFFLYGGLARGGGRGDQVELLEGAFDGTLVLVVPRFGIDTRWVYNKGCFPLTEVEKSVNFITCRRDQAYGKDASKELFNDLEIIVLGEFPELKVIERQLCELGAEKAMLSGSGSTIFGIFADRSQAQHAAQRLGSAYTVHVSQAVSRR